MNKLPEVGVPAVVVPEVAHKVGPGLAQSLSTHSVPVDLSVSLQLTPTARPPSTQRLEVLYQGRGRLLPETWLEDLDHELSGQA